jgi:hypothetical protein
MPTMPVEITDAIEPLKDNYFFYIKLLKTNFLTGKRSVAGSTGRSDRSIRGGNERARISRLASMTCNGLLRPLSV